MTHSAWAVQRIHSVAEGQTLGGIAKRYGTTVEALRKVNDLPRGAVLRVGQKLLIPNRGETKGPATTATTDGTTAESQTEGAKEGSSSEARTEPPPSPRRTHVVASGHTLGKIAKRYHVGIESLCRANGIRRSEVLRPGRTLVIPNGDDDPIIDSPELGSQTSSPNSDANDRRPIDSTGMRTLEVRGAGPVYFYTPTGSGRFTMRPVLVYLHGRGGNPMRDCHRWASVARRFGWLVCPSGPVAYNGGRAWNNSWPAGQHAVMGAIKALREEYGRRVQLFGNTLIGFSEGAYVAMNVGVREPRTFNRWLILGADTSYWGGDGMLALKDARQRVRRVVLITGEQDQVVGESRKVAGWLEKENVPLRVQTPVDLAHEIALERMPNLYESALRWLEGGQSGPRTAAQR